MTGGDYRARSGDGPGVLIRSPRRSACPCVRRRTAVVLVRFFLDQRRAELLVDRALDLGALVVADVDRARELDELRVEGLGFLLEANAVLDVPERFVDASERGALIHDVFARRVVDVPRRVEEIELD